MVGLPTNSLGTRRPADDDSHEFAAALHTGPVTTAPGPDPTGDRAVRVIEAGDTLDPSLRAGAAPVVVVVRDPSVLDGVDARLDLVAAHRRARALAAIRRADLLVAPSAAVADALAAVVPVGPWDMVVDPALALPDDVRERLARRHRPWSARRLAFATPLPPEPTGVAAYSYRLAAALARRCSVTCFLAGPAGPVPYDRRPPGAHVAAAGELPDRAGRGEFDEVLYAVGNQPRHGTQLELLRAVPGAVELHDVRLVGAYASLHPPGDALADEVARLYPGRYPSTLLRTPDLVIELAVDAGLWMAREFALLATSVLVHSAHAADLVRADTGVDAAVVGPLAVPSAAARAEPTDGDEPLVVSVGVMHPSKRAETLVQAMAVVADERPDAWLAFVGPIEPAYRSELNRLAAALGVGDRVVIAGEVDDDAYAGWLARASVAVQLRAHSNGESSAAITDCLARGLPTVVTADGAHRELDVGAAVAVEPAIDGPGLATVLTTLLADTARRRTLHRGALGYAAANSFDAAAERLLTALFGPDPA